MHSSVVWSTNTIVQIIANRQTKCSQYAFRKIIVVKIINFMKKRKKMTYINIMFVFGYSGGSRSEICGRRKEDSCIHKAQKKRESALGPDVACQITRGKCIVDAPSITGPRVSFIPRNCSHWQTYEASGYSAFLARKSSMPSLRRIWRRRWHLQEEPWGKQPGAEFHVVKSDDMLQEWWQEWHYVTEYKRLGIM